MGSVEEKMRQAVKLFDQQQYREAFTMFADAYNQSEDVAERKRIFAILEEAYYLPNAEGLKDRYEGNAAALKNYPYFWDKAFKKYEKLTVKLFPVNDEICYCYDLERDCFTEEYDPNDANQMRYFFDDLDGPIQVKDESNFYNLTFLNDNVRASDDYAGDNHVYLMYTSIEPLERLMQTCDLAEILGMEKFVFLVGEKNWHRYPINFKKKFNINYSKMEPSPIRIEEVKRFCFWYAHAYSGSIISQAALSESSGVQFFNGQMFNQHSYAGQELLFFTPEFQQAIVELDHCYTPNQIEEGIRAGKYTLALDGLDGFLDWLRKTRPYPHKYTVREMFCGYFLFKYSTRGLNPRVVPVLLYDPHMGTPLLYNNFLRTFPYLSVLTCVRDPVVSFARFLDYRGMCIGWEDNRIIFWAAHDYLFGQELLPEFRPNYCGIRFEDLKQNPEAVCRALCRTLNVPYAAKMLEADGSFNDLEGNTVKGFDDKPLHRDISGIMSEFDQLRFRIFYDPILKHYGYHRFSFEEHPLSDAIVRELFRYPFRLEYVTEKRSNGAVTRADVHRWLQKTLQGLWKKEVICPVMIPLEDTVNE